MITNIFDLFGAAGLPDPRKDQEFRKLLMTELKNIEDGVSIEDEPKDVIFESLSASDKAKFMKNALHNVEHNPSGVQKQEYANKLIEIYQANIDIKKILDLTPKEVDNLTDLPLRR